MKKRRIYSRYTEQQLGMIQEFKNRGYTNTEIAHLMNFKSKSQLRNIAYRLGINREKAIPVCKECQAPLTDTDQRKFCSRRCAASFNNRGVRRHGDPEGKAERDRVRANERYRERTVASGKVKFNKRSRVYTRKCRTCGESDLISDGKV